ncbi:hypothetical protein D9M72_138640 [compost metagenome]
MHQPRQRAFAHRHAPAPLRHRAAVGGVGAQRVGDFAQPRVIRDRQVQVFGRHAGQLVHQHLRQLPVGRAGRFRRRQVRQVRDEFPQQRRDGQRAALPWQIRRAGRHEQEAHAPVHRDAVAVRHAAGNPDAAVRRHHPQPLRHRAGHAAMQRQHQLAHAVPVRGGFVVVLGRVHAHSTGPLRVDVEVEEGGGAVQGGHGLWGWLVLRIVCHYLEIR